MKTSTLEQLAAHIPPRPTATEHNAFPHGRWGGSATGQLNQPGPLPGRDGAGEALQPAEELELRFCESRIERGLETFLEVGVALSLIRDKRLYRATHPTFEAYCIERWEIKASRARQLCAAAAVLHNLGLGKDADWSVPAHLPYEFPANERQVRPLIAVPAEQQRAVWEEAYATAPAGKVTAAHVASVAAKITGSLRTATGKPPKARADARPTAPKVQDAGTREEQLRAATERAIADVRALLDLHGTPDSEAASDVVVSLSKLETFREHLQRVKTLQAARQ